MEEIISLIFHGSKLVRDLESNMNFSNLANQPNILLKSCDEIIMIFSAARDRLNCRGSALYGQAHESQAVELGRGGVQEWLRYGYAEAMGLVQLPESRVQAGVERRELGLEVPGRELGGRDMGGGGGGGEVQPPDVSDSGRGSSSQRPRRRKDEVDRRTVKIPAPRMGNTEIPPEDGFTWRKYGQKEILGSKFPRSYYRCTHQKLYKCPAKKQVQRLDNDPFTFEVTYRANHTCHMSSTAPSVPPPPCTETISHMTHQQPATTTASPPPPPPPPPPTSVPLGRWLSMNIMPTGDGSSIFTDPHVHMYQDFGGTSSGTGMRSGGGMVGSGGAGMSSGSNMVGSGGAALSTTTTTRYGSNVDYQLPVADFADAMFNSGSSSNNSMDVIFSSMEDYREQGDNKKQRVW